MANLGQRVLRQALRVARRVRVGLVPPVIRRALYAANGVFVAEDALIDPKAVLYPALGGQIRVGHGTHIHAGAMLVTQGKDIEIGDSCTVNPYTMIYGGAKIGNGVRIATHCVIIPANHVFDDPERPIREQGLDRRGIVVEDDVWIGAHVTVLDGVRIARGCVVAAGAVVTKSTEPMGIYGGVPARLIKKRGEH